MFVATTSSIEKARSPLLQNIGLDPVPAAEKNFSWVDMWATWFAAGVITSIVAAAAQVTEATGKVGLSILGYQGGYIIGGLLTFMICALAAQHTGLANQTIIRVAVGVRGVVPAAVLIFLMMIAWNAIQLAVAGWAFSGALDKLGVKGWATNWYVWATIIGIVAAVVPPFRAGAAKWAQRVTAPAIAVIFAIALIVMFTTSDFGSKISAFEVAATPQFSWFVGVELGFGMALTWTLMVGDLARFGRNRKSAVLGATLGWFMGTIMSHVMGHLGVPLYGATDPSVSLAEIFWPFLIGIALCTIGTNIVDTYGGSYSLLNIVYGLRISDERKFPPWIPLLGIGVVSLFVAYLGERLFDFLVILYWAGLITAPLMGVFVCDWFFNVQDRRKLDPYMFVNHNNEVFFWNGFNVPGMVTWILGAGLYHLVYKLGGDTGLYFPSFIAFAFAFTLYYVLSRIFAEATEIKPRGVFAAALGTRAEPELVRTEAAD